MNENDKIAAAIKDVRRAMLDKCPIDWDKLWLLVDSSKDFHLWPKTRLKVEEVKSE